MSGELVFKDAMTLEESRSVAKELSGAGARLNFYKGMLWNAMSNTTRAAICAEFGFSYTYMKQCGYISNKFRDNILEDYGHLSWSHFKVAAPKEDPEEVLSLAVLEGWTSTEVTKQYALMEEAAQEQLDQEAGVREERSVNGVQELLGAATITDKEAEVQEEVEVDLLPLESGPDYSLSSMVGLSKTQISPKLLGLIKRYLGRQFHPDTGGSHAEWLRFEEALSFLESSFTVEEFKEEGDWFHTEEEYSV